jgi:hypothetical protein
LEEVVSSVADKMLPEINKQIETIISQRLGPNASSTEGSKATSNIACSINESNLCDLDHDSCFDSISPQSITSVNDDLGLHVAQSLKQKIMKGEFVELHMLLNKQADIETSESRVIFMNGQLTLKPNNTAKITTIDTWLDAFFIYMSIYLSAHIEHTHSLIKYMANVKLGASRVSGGLGWREYDRQFRLKRAKDNSISWDKIDPELWLLYITPNTGVQSVSKNSLGSSKFCYEYNNKGSCRIQNCHYQHQCLKCQNKHPAIHCPYATNKNAFSKASQAPSSGFRQSGSKFSTGSFRKNRFNSS